MRSTVFIRPALALMLCALAACRDAAPPQTTLADAQRAESLRPTAELLERYERSCMACHTSVDGNAPLTGNIAQWQPRLTKGMDVLVRHAMEGFNAMPPKGLCADCSEADMRALIVFMSEAKQ